MIKPNFDENRSLYARVGAVVLIAMAGLLILASLIFDYGATGPAVSNSILAFIAIVFGLLIFRNPLASAPLCWLTMGLGLWFFIAPFVLGFNGFIVSMGLNLIVGILLMIFSGLIIGEALRLNQPLDAHS